jgi:acyl carrier protein
MKEQEFLKTMVEIMDTEAEITMDSVLDEIEEWDSLSYVAFLAMSRAKTDKTIAPADVKAAKTIGDLYALITGGK